MLALLLLVLLLLPATLAHAQTRGCWPAPAGAPDSARTAAALARRVAHAARLTGPAPTMDGKLDDPAWCRATPLTDQIQSSPNPGALATLPTVTRVLYDDDAIYVAVRAWDPHADSIVAPYPRRDDENTSDWVFVELDTRHDHRSGFSFGVNPRGVQVDGTWSDDVNYDADWNSVWQAASSMDASGWSAEYRIPFSQLALAAARRGAPLVWGINVYRYSPHRGESSNWSPRLPSVTGIVSHFNELDGIESPPGHAQLDLVPYAAATGSRDPGATTTRATTGADFRYRPLPSTSIALSLHPDFGQVEADPSQVNLTTFEAFLPEQRPLFVESGQLFQFGAPLSFASRGTSFDQEAPFYSRRIGRAPRAACPANASRCDLPNAAPVLAALRASGRSANGWQGGFFDAWTGPADARFTLAPDDVIRRETSPLTQFAAGRVVRELDEGRAAVGMIATYTGRMAMRDGTDSLFAGHAMVLGGDGRVRLGGDAWEMTGWLLGSQVGGSDSYLRRLRINHGYARPDSLGLPPVSVTATGPLSGVSAQVAATRTSGSLQGGVATRLVTRGFESNDMGFQRNSDWFLVTGHWQYFKYRPGHGLRRWSVGSDQLGAGWTLGGLRRAAVANVKAKLDFRNFWGGALSLDHEFAAADPAVLRGGPPLLLPGRSRLTFDGYTDSRKRWQATLSLSGEVEPASHSLDVQLAPGLTAFVNDRLQLALSPEFALAREGWQYVATASDSSGAPHYVLGGLHQATASLTTRATYAFSAHLTLQLYAQAFLSGGRYTDFKEVVAPADPDPDRRVVPLRAEGSTLEFPDPDFSDRELHLNLLFRWEFLPGSTLFLVWTHARTASAPSPFALGHDVRMLLDAPAANALQAKLSYWIGA